MVWLTSSSTLVAWARVRSTRSVTVSSTRCTCDFTVLLMSAMFVAISLRYGPVSSRMARAASSSGMARLSTLPAMASMRALDFFTLRKSPTKIPAWMTTAMEVTMMNAVTNVSFMKMLDSEGGEGRPAAYVSRKSRFNK